MVSDVLGRSISDISRTYCVLDLAQETQPGLMTPDERLSIIRSQVTPGNPSQVVYTALNRK